MLWEFCVEQIKSIFCSCCRQNFILFIIDSSLTDVELNDSSNCPEWQIILPEFGYVFLSVGKVSLKYKTTFNHGWKNYGIAVKKLWYCSVKCERHEINEVSVMSSNQRDIFLTSCHGYDALLFRIKQVVHLWAHASVCR